QRVITIHLDETLGLVEEIMRLAEIRHVPVVKGGELVGIVSQRDLLRAMLSSAVNPTLEEQKSFLESVDIQKAMTTEVVTIGADAPVREAARLMLERRIGCLPVLGEKGELVGLLTEADILRYLVEQLPEA
ncbi:MAG: CBS domain-containing protein, partial [Nitrospinota bacterium]